MLLCRDASQTVPKSLRYSLTAFFLILNKKCFEASCVPVKEHKHNQSLAQHFYSYSVGNIFGLSGLSCEVQSIVNPSLTSLPAPLIDIFCEQPESKALAGAQLVVNPRHSNDPNTIDVLPSHCCSTSTTRVNAPEKRRPLKIFHN